MSHPQQRKFCKEVRRRFPEYFKEGFVIDVGSLSINGDNRYLFQNFFAECAYVGIDIVKGKNVDIVGVAHEVLPNIRWVLKEMIESRYRRRVVVDEPEINVVISTECAEHDAYVSQTWTEMYKVLRAGGLMIITAAGPGRAEHGTHTHAAWCSPGTNDFYKNVTFEDFEKVLPPSLFSEYHLSYDMGHFDFQFYGIKKNASDSDSKVSGVVQR